MNCKEVKIRLNDYIDNLLSEEESKIISGHLEKCPECRYEYEELSSIIEEAKLIPNEIEPAKDLWNTIAQRIGFDEKNAKIFKLDKSPSEDNNYKLKFKSARLHPGRRVVYAVSFAAVVMLAFLFLFLSKPQHQDFLFAERLEGLPSIGDKKIRNEGRIKLGEYITTDDSSKARLKIASIGEVDIFPNSRVRLVVSKPYEYRILLEKGMIDASIWAPPKLFFVETPSATAIDLGCRYTLEVEPDGTSFLHVIMGKVAFEFAGRESIVPSGAVCETRLNAGPGTPHYPTAAESLKTALSKLDFENGDEKLVDVVVGNAEKDDAISLWHLLKRKDNRCKMKIFMKLKDMFDIPSDITIQKIVQGDEETFDRLWTILKIGEKKSLSKNLTTSTHEAGAF